jgi:hypothetical protein
MDKDVKPSQLLFVHEVFGPKIRYYSSNLTGKWGRIKLLDGSYPGFSGANRFPVFLNTGSQGSHHSQAGNNDPSHLTTSLFFLTEAFY